MFTGSPTHWQNVPDMIQTHLLVKQSGLPILLSLRIPIQTKLNIDRWRYHLAEHFDSYQLSDLLEFGFLLDFDITCVLGKIEDNHTSAKHFPGHVDKYIQHKLDFETLYN